FPRNVPRLNFSSLKIMTVLLFPRGIPRYGATLTPLGENRWISLRLLRVGYHFVAVGLSCETFAQILKHESKDTRRWNDGTLAFQSRKKAMGARRCGCALCGGPMHNRA